MRRRGRPPNLLVLGASGSVARAFLRRLPAQRRLFGKVLLLDQRPGILRDPFLNLRVMGAGFIRRRLSLPDGAAAYRALLRKNRIDVVLDLTVADTLPILAVTDAMKVSYVNTCLNDEKRGAADLVLALFPRPRPFQSAPHVLCAGMNPGVVNGWAVYGVGKFGKPREIVHFEYDTSRPAGPWRPTITWSKLEFLTEAVWQPSGVVLGDMIKPLLPNALAHRVPMRGILEPIWKLPRYPSGMTVLHEENITVGRRYGVPSKFIYAIDPDTLRSMKESWERRRTVGEEDLVLGDNVTVPLTGGDHIGLYLEYPGRRVYYFNALQNEDVVGTNATCAQVAVGIYCALLTLLRDRLEPGCHFVGDLIKGTSYLPLVFNAMRVAEYVFRRRGRRLALEKHTPRLRLPLPPDDGQVF